VLFTAFIFCSKLKAMSALRISFLLGAVVSISGCCSGELTAQRYNEQRDCLEEVEEVGCAGSNTECDDALTVAESEYGSLWLFPDSCIPEDFTVVDGRFAEELTMAPLCSSL
jgi:hypothetical protein